MSTTLWNRDDAESSEAGIIVRLIASIANKGIFCGFSREPLELTFDSIGHLITDESSHYESSSSSSSSSCSDDDWTIIAIIVEEESSSSSSSSEPCSSSFTSDCRPVKIRLKFDELGHLYKIADEDCNLLWHQQDAPNNTAGIKLRVHGFLGSSSSESSCRQPAQADYDILELTFDSLGHLTKVEEIEQAFCPCGCFGRIPMMPRVICAEFRYKSNGPGGPLCCIGRTTLVYDPCLQVTQLTQGAYFGEMHFSCAPFQHADLLFYCTGSGSMQLEINDQQTTEMSLIQFTGLVWCPCFSSEEKQITSGDYQMHGCCQPVGGEYTTVRLYEIDDCESCSLESSCSSQPGQSSSST